MAITDAQKIDLLFKKLAFGATKTDTSDQKGPTNEAIASPLLIRSDTLWAQSSDIPATAPGSSTGVVRFYNVLELSADITATTDRTWLTNKTDWIPPEFGSTYQAKIYIHDADDSENAAVISNQVFAAGSGNNDEWYFDYQAGVLNFIGSNLPSGISGKSVYIAAYTYVGNFGLSSSGFDSDQIVAIINENSGTGMTDSDLQIVADLRNDVDSDFKLLRKFKFQDPSFTISTYDYDPRYAYMRGQAVAKDGSVIDDSDTDALWLYDTYNDEFIEKIFEHPRYDVGGLAISEKSEKPVYISYYGEKPERVWLDKDLENVYKSIEASFPNDKVSIGSWTKNEDKAIVTTWSDRNPGEMYYYDRNRGSISLIAKSRPWIDKNEMSPMIPIEFTARDGLTINGYLTVPVNSDGKNLPLIVNPHGGPNARDYWGYNREHQFFASRGYAVLSMNFRGSTGYGRSHVKSANKEWGRKMQDDVTDSVKWAVSQGIANPDKICIHGASYGGYAVMAGITKTPDLYKCAVNYVGVTDMKLLFTERPKVWEIWDEQQKVEIGDYETEKEYLDEVSPINLVDRIKTPLYIVHGKLDWRVDIKHAEVLRKELKKVGKKEGEDYFWMVKGDEGHGFVKPENNLELYSELEKFYATYLN